MTESQENLFAARKLHRTLALRANKAWSLVQAIQAQRIFVPRAQALEMIASAIYYNASYDAGENYADVSEFATELAPEVDAEFPVQELSTIEMCYVLQPYLSERPAVYLSKLGFGYLQGCAPNELRALNVAVPADVAELGLVGASEYECQVLIRHYEQESLRIINAFRHLATALNYVTSRLSGGVRLEPTAPELRHDQEVHALVPALVALCTLPISPEPARHFGTEASKTNPLRELPLPAVELETLLT